EVGARRRPRSPRAGPRGALRRRPVPTARRAGSGRRECRIAFRTGYRTTLQSQVTDPSFEARHATATQDEPQKQLYARGRIALSGGGLRPLGPVGKASIPALFESG